RLVHSPMSTREAKSRTRGKEADIDRPQNNYPTTAEALHDLARFLEGQSHMPDAPLQLEDIVSDLDFILDDALLTSMEDLFEDSIFREIEEDDPTYNLRKRPAYALLKKLRDLQKTR